MRFQIDLKSLLIGILLATCVFVAMGASQAPVPVQLVGRYQLMPVPYQAEPYIIDGDTGRVWRKKSNMSEFAEIEISKKAAAENNKYQAGPADG